MRHLGQNALRGNVNSDQDYYTYATSFASIGAGVEQSQSINIETDAEFTAIKVGVAAHIAGAAQTAETRVLPLVNLSVNDAGSGRNLQNTPIPIMLLSGDGSLPFILPKPRVFQGNATINITIANYSAATTYSDLVVALIGYKTFY